MLFVGEELGRPPHIDEVFKQTHVRKSTGEFVDERSRKTIVSRVFFIIYFIIICTSSVYIFE